MVHCTIITIAHRLHTVLNSDRVVLMQEGEILEVGSPRELLSDHSSAFYSMALEAGLVHDDKSGSEKE